MLCHDILGTNAKARSIGDKRKAFLYLRRAGEGAGPLLCVGNQESDSVRSYWIDAETGGAENAFLDPLFHSERPIYQDRLGTNT
jgi:hypothetical protein